MGKKRDRKLLKVLKAVRRDVRKDLIKGKKPRQAICALVIDEGGSPKYREHLEELWPKWPRFSGLTSYPVPSTNLYLRASDMYIEAWENGKLWSGKYGRLRIKLLNWVIDHLEEKVNVD